MGGGACPVTHGLPGTRALIACCCVHSDLACPLTALCPGSFRGASAWRPCGMCTATPGCPLAGCSPTWRRWAWQWTARTWRRRSSRQRPTRRRRRSGSGVRLGRPLLCTARPAGRLCTYTGPCNSPAGAPDPALPPMLALSLPRHSALHCGTGGAQAPAPAPGLLTRAAPHPAGAGRPRVSPTQST